MHPGGGGVSPARGGQVHLGGGGVSPAAWGGGSGPAGGGVSPASRGGGGQHFAPSCGRYASCVHAGGLSCFFQFLKTIVSENFSF